MPAPIPAVVLVVDAGGVIRWVDVHPDHVTRTEPATSSAPSTLT
jgi:hypothetical protein